MEINGGFSVVLLSAGKVDSVVQLDVADGRVQCVYIMGNPEKLASLPMDG